VIGEFRRRHRTGEFRRFLETVAAAVADSLGSVHPLTLERRCLPSLVLTVVR
jgi:hypothetical protein